jgi:hypothetical protein
MAAGAEAGEGYARVALADLPALEGELDSEWLPVRRALGIASFGVNAFTAPSSGGLVIEDHDESDSGHEELYVVLSGGADFTVGDDTFGAPAGTLVAVRDPALRRVAYATSPRTTVLAVAGVPGAPFEPRDWELRGTAGLGAR